MSLLGVVSADHNPLSSPPFPPGVAQIFSGLPPASPRDLHAALLGDAAVASSDGLTLLFAGALFDAASLALQLSCDATLPLQLVLQAYRRWGQAFLPYLQGEFSFALWDSHHCRLLLGRDPSGQHPLFYLHQHNRLYFADTVRSLLACMDAEPAPDEQHIAHWFALLPPASDSTFFRGVRCLPPGHTLVLEQGRLALRDDWQPERLPLQTLHDPRQYATGLREVLQTAIADRLPLRDVGSHLSGGLDSSSVTAVAANLLRSRNESLFAFTAVPAHAVHLAGSLTDEGPYAAAVAALYPNIDHVLVRQGTHPVFWLIDRFSSAQLEPIFNPANYDWLYEIGLQARARGVATLLTGFAGNLTISYNGAEALAALMRDHRFLAAAGLARGLHRTGAFRTRALAHRLLRPWAPLWARNAVDKVRGRRSAPGTHSFLRDEFALAHGLDPAARSSTLQDLDSRSLRLWGLRRADPGPFANGFQQLTGVGLTDPTADRRVMEYCFTIPPEHFCEHGVPRSLLRNAMAGLLPEAVLNERRKGVQAADFSTHFRVQRPEALAELRRMRSVNLAARALDLDAIESRLRWTEAQIDHFGQKNFWPPLLRALSLGRFLRRLEDGSLLSS